MKILITPASFKTGAAGSTMENLRSFTGNGTPESLVFNPKVKPLSEDELITLLKGCEKVTVTFFLFWVGNMGHCDSCY